ncbi:MAG: TRAP transporter substrate-binding protein [Acetivibrionales bacterium]|jgi:tripartite ATP-independent transporter DctP family solute receptor
MLKRVLTFALTVVMVFTMVACAQQSTPVQDPNETIGDAEVSSQNNEESKETSKKPIVWTVGSTTSEDHPSIKAFNMLADALSEATDGRWTLEVYANSTIGTEQECIDMCRAGTLTICATNLTIMEQFIPDFGVFALPYLFRSWEDYVDYVDNSKLCRELLDQLEQSSNLRFLEVELNGTRCLSTNKIGTISKPADLNGVKIRSMEAQVWQDIIKALGGTPIPVNFSELYMALQTGVVNGQDNPIALLYSNKFYEVLDNIYRTDHCYNTVAYWVNPQAYDALDDADKKLIDELVQKYLVDEYEKMMLDYNKEAEDVIKENGVRIWEPEEFDINAFYASSDEMVNEKYLPDERYSKYILDIRQRYNY